MKGKGHGKYLIGYEICTKTGINLLSGPLLPYLHFLEYAGTIVELLSYKTPSFCNFLSFEADRNKMISHFIVFSFHSQLNTKQYKTSSYMKMSTV